MLLLLGALLAAIIYRWISLERWRRSVEQTEVTPAHPPEPTTAPAPTLPKPPVIGGKLDTARLFNGITLNANVETTPGGAASVERLDPNSYALDLKLRARVPAPNQTIEELAKVSPELPRVLPGLASMLTPESVSPYFAELYDTKVKRLRANLSRLDQLLSRHNFYDTQTVLRLKHPQSQRKAVLLQSEMDVDADGSDSDRLPAGSGTSPNFQPFTSYRWPKKTANPNPYAAALEQKIKTNDAETALPATNAARKAELKAANAQTRDSLETLKHFSFLIGATDPYIVIPGGFTKAEGAKVGDYAVVIYGDAIYPAVVGDVGPPDKTGEASLRIAKEISAAANPMNRPVNDLKVTYLIFPGTADATLGPPDLDKLHDRCEGLLNDIGGAGVPMHRWENMIPPPPTPTPSPSPTRSPAPTAAASASATASPEASAAPTFAFALPSPGGSPSATPSPTPAATPSPSPTAKLTPPPSRKHS